VGLWSSAWAVVLTMGCRATLRPFLASFCIVQTVSVPGGLHCVVHCVVFATASFKLV
jgi:hypothetical protein